MNRDQKMNEQAAAPNLRTSPELEAQLYPLGTTVHALEGESVIRQGAHSRGVYLLIEGAVRLNMLSDDGQEISSRELGPGALLGVPATLCFKPYLFTAIATLPSRLVFIEKEKLDDCLRAHPSLCMEVVQMMSRELADANQTRNLLKRCTESVCSLARPCTEHRQ